MVDALCRTLKWLTPSGCVIDLRPAETLPRIGVGPSGGEGVHVGGLVVEPERHERHAAADRAVAAVLARKQFVIDDAREFVFDRYADSAEELRDYIARSWRQTRMDDATVRRAAETLAARPGMRLWLRERAGIRRLRPVR